MTKRAYVLIETEIGKAWAVAKELQNKPDIAAVDLVTGPHDVIAVLQSASADAIAKAVMDEIQAVPGIIRTTTYIAISTGSNEG